MIYTRWPVRSYALLLAWLLATVIAAPSHAADWDIDQLMHGLAQTRSAQARFVEKKTLAILDQPVESSGELRYTAPDRLEKRTVKPKPETMVVDGNQLEIERGQQKIKLRLQDYPELAAFIDSIRGTLAGDRQALERSYQLSLEGSAQSWTLKLVPIGSRMKQVVALIRIRGARDELRSVDVMQVDGDRAFMRIEKVAAP